MEAVSTSVIHTTYPSTVWKKKARNYEDRIRGILGSYLAERRNGVKNPVIDFLFEYYAFRPTHLLQWTPGLGERVSGPGVGTFLEYSDAYHADSEGVSLDIRRFPGHRRQAAVWIRDFLQATIDRPPMFGCHGLHEWAMVYKTDEIRHAQVPLRLSAEEIAYVVEKQSVLCTHFDAFRFFSAEARPLNARNLHHEDRMDHEQPGCLHVTMDLYKWCFKFDPWVPGDLTAEAFELAVHTRELDMKASPYDLRDYGYEPIPIESREGRREYRQKQRALFEKSQPIRQRLLRFYDRMLELV